MLVAFNPDPLPTLKAQMLGWSQELGIASDCKVASWIAQVNSFDSSDITKPLNKGKGSLHPVGKHQDAVLTASRTQFRLWLQTELGRIEKERQVSERR